MCAVQRSIVASTSSVYNQTIDVDTSIDSGQVFMWKKWDYPDNTNTCWYGIDGAKVLKIYTHHPEKITSYKLDNDKCKTCLNDTDFFRTGDNMQKILDSICTDDTVNTAVKRYQGLRILRQDPFQCMISFLTSSNSNIPRIRKNLETICQRYGEKITVDNKEFFVFPTAKKIAEASESDIRRCGLGYRSGYIVKAARMVASKQIDFEELKRAEYAQALETIQKVPGIGCKVADCILLFSLEKLEAFPLDRWMLRALDSRHYKDRFVISRMKNREVVSATTTTTTSATPHKKGAALTSKQYHQLHDKVVKYFGSFAGYAQQFLFKMERDEYGKIGWRANNSKENTNSSLSKVQNVQIS